MLDLCDYHWCDILQGYGFVEFVNPLDAQKCVAVFTKMGCKLPTGMPPEELTSIKTFSMEDPPDEMVNTKEECEPPKKKAKKGKEKKPKDAKTEEAKEDIPPEVCTPSIWCSYHSECYSGQGGSLHTKRNRVSTLSCDKFSFAIWILDFTIGE